MYCYAKQCKFATNLYNFHVSLLLVVNVMFSSELCQLYLGNLASKADGF